MSTLYVEMHGKEIGYREQYMDSTRDCVHTGSGYQTFGVLVARIVVFSAIRDLKNGNLTKT